MTVHFNFDFWGSFPSMTWSLRKWEYKAIDMKSILIQDCVGFFSSFCNRYLLGCYKLAGWSHWASKSRTPRLLEGCSWVSTGSVLWFYCVLNYITRLNASFVFLPFIRISHCGYFQDSEKNGLNFTAVSLRSLLNHSLVWSVFEKHGSGLVLFCFIFGGNENKEKYSGIGFVCLF